ncbi:hypothetical protein B0J18DRAFT_440784 [Chaetomium sp. MPI-SDFR-AT-0129]|nr:hypothetical protein B0J18DRAFT_440784 [Chaetomium sp. MPI-SDFR-AT-0129]
MDSQQPASQPTLQRPQPAHVHRPLTTQPAASQPMNPRQPHPETEAELGLRGGRSEMCPGRFCFCVPCPLPCDFCII